MKKSIIGHTGFVGKNLCDQYIFDYCYNSKTISKIIEEEHDIVFCAAPSAEKWIANKNPTEDLLKIFSLINNLKNAKIKKIILFSTIDVYGSHTEADEDSLIDIRHLHPYGKNRYILENSLKDLFDINIIRLPALFGKYLKKNILFDALNFNMIEKISLNTYFQWFYLNNLKEQINFVLEKDIKLFNCVTEPVHSLDIFNLYFKNIKNVCTGTANTRYNVKTKYFDTGYIYSKEKVLKEMDKFINDFNNKFSLE